MMSGILPPPGSGVTSNKIKAEPKISTVTGSLVPLAEIKTEIDTQLIPTSVQQPTRSVPNATQQIINARAITTGSTVLSFPQTATSYQNVSSQGLQQTTVSTQQDTNPNGLTSDEMTNVTKCKNFLRTLIQLAQNNEQTNPQTVSNVKELVQQLIDDRIPAEEFTERLQTALQSTPQPYLVPFLRKSLPLLRRSMQNGTTKQRQTQPQATMSLPVKRAPTDSNMISSTVKHQIKQEPSQPNNTHTNQRVVANTHKPNIQRHIQNPVPRITITNQPVPPNVRVTPQQIGPAVRRPPRSMPIQTPVRKVQSTITNRDDDRDETDVTVMADVNLENESKIMTRSDHVGTEIRNAPGGDEPNSINKAVLHKLVGQAASRAGDIERVTPDGARLIGLALEEYVKHLVSKAIHAASHRNMQFKDNEHRHKLNDVKAQYKILNEIMQIEKQKAEEAEQEQRAKLLRSRNKKEEDPEREKKKKDAKLKQQAMQDREQQKQADETALEASRRKRPAANMLSSSVSGTNTSRVNRVTRVKMRDILFCLESERLDKSSRDEVYKRYLK